MTFQTLIVAALVWAFALLGVLAAVLVRKGDVPRRLVLNDTAVQLVMVVLALLAIRRQEAHYLDAALALALLSFVSSIVVATHAARHRRSR